MKPNNEKSLAMLMLHTTLKLLANGRKPLQYTDIILKIRYTNDFCKLHSQGSKLINGRLELQFKEYLKYAVTSRWLREDLGYYTITYNGISASKFVNIRELSNALRKNQPNHRSSDETKSSQVLTVGLYKRAEEDKLWYMVDGWRGK